MDIQGKVVIVTGASDGIGLATAHRLAAAGAKVVLSARSQEKLEATAGELRSQGYEAVAIPADMRLKPDVDRMVEETARKFGRLDALVNNAGQAVAGDIASLDLEAFRQIIDLNVFGPVYAMQAVIPHMRGNGGGVIVNVSSMVSKMAIPGLAGYASTKAALNMLSQTARGELAPENIRVITVFPRMTATSFGKNSLGNREMRQRQRGAPPR
ncbi:MAG TPA: SDR family oxidoreductase, partial [Armatimonadota bacterium]